MNQSAKLTFAQAGAGPKLARSRRAGGSPDGTEILVEII
jgi:hypothetical protein